MTQRTFEQRFWAKVDVGHPLGCWEWTAQRNRGGYGRIRLTGRGAPQVVAHRVAFELLRGPIPDGHELDHLCRNRGCVNPDHLEPVTPLENALRGESINARNARKTRCTNGHALIGDNVLVVNGGKSRRCRTCTREQQARWAREQRRRAKTSS